MADTIPPCSPTMLAIEATEGDALVELTCSDHGRYPPRYDPLTELWLCGGEATCTTYATVEYVAREWVQRVVARGGVGA